MCMCVLVFLVDSDTAALDIDGVHNAKDIFKGLGFRWTGVGPQKGIDEDCKMVKGGRRPESELPLLEVLVSRMKLRASNFQRYDSERARGDGAAFKR